jgi:hypothetical protein
MQNLAKPEIVRSDRPGDALTVVLVKTKLI